MRQLKIRVPQQKQDMNSTFEGRAPVDPAQPRGSLPKHLAAVRLPNGRTLGQLSGADIARLLQLAGVPGADRAPEMGRQQLAELMTSTLDSIGREAAERAIANWLNQNFAEVLR
ncbi:MAG: hypothetical protein JNM89_15975 [Hyphomicrobiaceae bacterium]|nr:hypothetical protein [Hyphomicrobiaceae bacterium]